MGTICRMGVLGLLATGVALGCSEKKDRHPMGHETNVYDSEQGVHDRTRSDRDERYRTRSGQDTNLYDSEEGVGGDAGVNLNDGEILGYLVAINQTEVRASEQAVNKNVPEEVRDFARRMQNEHGSNLARTERLARERNVTPAERKQARDLRQQGDATVERLSRLNGAEYARAYMDAMVKDHSKALDLIDQRLLPSARDSEVRQHLTQTRSRVAEHLRRAREIRDNLE